MKVLSKIEKCVMAIVMMCVRYYAMVLGLNRIFDNLLYDSTMINTITCIAAIVVLYVEIKKCVFRFIEIIKG